MDILPRPARQLRHINRPALDVRPALVKVPAHRQVRHMDVIGSTPQQPIASLRKPTLQPSGHQVGRSSAMHGVPAHMTRPLLPAVEPVRTPRPVIADTKTPKRRLRTNVIAVYGMAVALFVAGLGITIQGLVVNHQVIQQTKALSDASSNSASETAAVPSEEKPQGDYLKKYVVAAQLPRVIRIPKLGVEARVLQVGVDGANQMQTPRNIYDTAWYNGSSRPGEAGAMVINGHYSGPTTHGVFSKLTKLVAGDLITIERGDGKVLTYEVQSLETRPASEVDMNKLMVSTNTAIPALNLITCSGDYDVRANEFADRTVVYTLQK